MVDLAGLDLATVGWSSKVTPCAVWDLGSFSTAINTGKKDSTLKCLVLYDSCLLTSCSTFFFFLVSRLIRHSEKCILKAWTVFFVLNWDLEITTVVRLLAQGISGSFMPFSFK